MRRIFKRPKIDWRYALGELVLIVAGILIAIALNSWWQDRSDYDRETTYLIGIEIDIRNSQAEVLSAITYHRQAVDALRTLVHLIEAGPSAARLDSLPALSHALVFYSIIEPELATYDEMVASGRLNLIESDSIRAALTAYEYAVQNNNDFNAYIKEQSVQVIEPFFMRHLVYQPLHGLEVPARAPEIDLSPLFTDLHFRNLIMLRLDTEASVLETRRQLLAAMRTLQRLVNKELEKRGVATRT